MTKLTSDILEFLDGIKNRLQDDKYLRFRFEDFCEFIPTYYGEEHLDSEEVKYLHEAMVKVGLSSEPRISQGFIKRSIFSPVYIYNENASLDIQAESYRYGLMMLRVAVMMAKVDGDVVETETTNIMNMIENAAFLSGYEKCALQAKAKFLLDKDLKYDDRARDYIRITLDRETFLKKIESMSRTSSFLLLNVAKQVALADGVIEKSENRLLQDMYRTLDLPARSTKSDLNKYMTKHGLEAGFWDDNKQFDEKELAQLERILDEFSG